MFSSDLQLTGYSIGARLMIAATDLLPMAFLFFAAAYWFWKDLAKEKLDAKNRLEDSCKRELARKERLENRGPRPNLEGLWVRCKWEAFNESAPSYNVRSVYEDREGHWMLWFHDGSSGNADRYVIVNPPNPFV